jgi:hypothetical protein
MFNGNEHPSTCMVTSSSSDLLHRLLAGCVHQQAMCASQAACKLPQEQSPRSQHKPRL